jgi:hypothetical protein
MVARMVPHLQMLLTPIPDEDARVVDRLGGAPNAWAADDGGAWPVCGACQQPLHFVVQLAGDAAGGCAPLGEVTALQLFACHNEGDCGFYEARSSAHHVALRRKPLLAQTIERPGGRQSPTVDDPLLEGHAITYQPGADEPELIADYDDPRQEAAFSNGFVDKLGGVAVAANLPDELACATCAQPLAFLAQILSADDWFIYYLHRCGAGHEVTFHAHRA